MANKLTLEWLEKMGRLHLANARLDVPAELRERCIEDVRIHHTHEDMTEEDIIARGEARAICLYNHGDSIITKAESHVNVLDTSMIHHHLIGVKRGLWAVVVILILLLIALFLSPRLHAQVSTQINGNNPGASTKSAVSVIPNCAANTNCFAVQPVGAGSGGTSSTFGQAFPNAGTAVGVKNGANMVNLVADNSGNLDVNCIVGCSAAGDQNTTSTALGALNAVITVPLAGERGITFQLQSGGTGVYTVTPQCSYDGGVVYNTNAYIQDPVTGVVTTTAVIASAQATTDYPVSCPGGASHAQMKVTAYTSGTANWLARSTVMTWPSLAWGIVTTNAPSYTTGQINGVSLDTSGLLRVSLKDTPSNTNNLNFNLAASAATVTVTGTITANAGSNLNTSALALDTSVNGILVSQGSTTSGEKGPLAQGAVTTSAPSYTTAQTSPLSLNTSGGLRVDGSGVTQPVSGTITANAGSGNFSENLAQVAGNSTATAATGVQKVGIVGNTGATLDAAPGAANPTNNLQICGTDSTNCVTPYIDPCQRGAKTYVSINQTANTKIVTGTAAKKIYVCSFQLISATAQNVAAVEGTGATCGTGTAGVNGAGGPAAATGWNLAANGGLVYGMGGFAVMQEGTAADDFCIFQSGAGQVSGGMSYVVI